MINICREQIYIIYLRLMKPDMWLPILLIVVCLPSLAILKILSVQSGNALNMFFVSRINKNAFVSGVVEIILSSFFVDFPWCLYSQPPCFCLFYTKIRMSWIATRTAS